jgi:hypothetical protein
MWKLLGRKALLWFGVFLSGEMVAFADLVDNRFTPDGITGSSGPIGQIFLDSIGLQNVVLDGRITIEDPSRGGEIVPEVIDGPLIPQLSDYAKTDSHLELAEMYDMIGNANIARWIFALAETYHDSGERYLDEASGAHGLLDSGGTVATIHDPIAGGGKVNIGINSTGQIVGFVSEGRGKRSAPGKAIPRLSPVAEPHTLPLLIACVPIFVIAVRKSRPRTRIRRIVYSSRKEKRMAAQVSTGSAVSASSAN